MTTKDITARLNKLSSREFSVDQYDLFIKTLDEMYGLENLIVREYPSPDAQGPEGPRERMWKWKSKPMYDDPDLGRFWFYGNPRLGDPEPGGEIYERDISLLQEEGSQEEDSNRLSKKELRSYVGKIIDASGEGSYFIKIITIGRKVNYKEVQYEMYGEAGDLREDLDESYTLEMDLEEFLDTFDSTMINEDNVWDEADIEESLDYAYPRR